MHGDNGSEQGDLAAEPVRNAHDLDNSTGITLREHMSSMAPGPDEALHWGMLLAQAVAAEHERGIWLRELTPANLVIDRDGRVRVLVSRPEEPATTAPGSETSHDSAVSLRDRAPLYMAPEQWAAKPVDGSADVWALGIILFELCSGRHPLLGNAHLTGEREPLDIRHIRERVCSSDTAPLLSEFADAPERLSTLVAACLSKDSIDRPAAIHVASILRDLHHTRQIAEIEDAPTEDVPVLPIAASLSETASAPETTSAPQTTSAPETASAPEITSAPTAIPASEATSAPTASSALEGPQPLAAAQEPAKSHNAPRQTHNERGSESRLLIPLAALLGAALLALLISRSDPQEPSDTPSASSFDSSAAPHTPSSLPIAGSTVVQPTASNSKSPPLPTASPVLSANTATATSSTPTGAAATAQPYARTAPEPANDRCRTSTQCASKGQCTASPDGSCIATRNQDCAASQACRNYGACAVRNGQCAATSAQHCEGSQHCRNFGRCTPSATDGACWARSDAQCRSSGRCRSHGACSHLAGRGLCAPASDSDCRASTGCLSQGRCSLASASCSISSDADCRRSQACQAQGRCRLKRGPSGRRCVE